MMIDDCYEQGQINELILDGLKHNLLRSAIFVIAIQLFFVQKLYKYCCFGAVIRIEGRRVQLTKALIKH